METSGGARREVSELEQAWELVYTGGFKVYSEYL